MKRHLAAGLITFTAACSHAQSPERASAAEPLRARLTGDVIKQAVKETLAESGKDAPLDGRTVLGVENERHEKFSRQFSEAKVPDCLHGDALKFQPTFFGGILAAPFVLAAALRGKCR